MEDLYEAAAEALLGVSAVGGVFVAGEVLAAGASLERGLSFGGGVETGVAALEGREGTVLAAAFSGFSGFSGAGAGVGAEITGTGLEMVLVGVETFS